MLRFSKNTDVEITKPSPKKRKRTGIPPLLPKIPSRIAVDRMVLKCVGGAANCNLAAEKLELHPQKTFVTC